MSVGLTPTSLAGPILYVLFKSGIPGHFRSFSIGLITSTPSVLVRIRGVGKDLTIVHDFKQRFTVIPGVFVGQNPTPDGGKNP